MENITRLEEKIYLLCFFHPKYISELSKALYRSYSRTITRKIKSMEGIWIDVYHPSAMPNFLLGRLNSKRESLPESRKYCYSKPEPLLDSFIDELKEKNIKLEEDERESLLILFDSEEFRKFVYNNIMKFKRKYDIREYPIDYIYIKQAFILHITTTLQYKKLEDDGILNDEVIMDNRLIDTLKIYNVIPEIVNIIEEHFSRNLLEKLCRLDDKMNDAFNGFYSIIDYYATKPSFE